MCVGGDNNCLEIHIPGQKRRPKNNYDTTKRENIIIRKSNRCHKLVALVKNGAKTKEKRH